MSNKIPSRGGVGGGFQIWLLCLTCPSASFAHQFGDLYHVITQLQRAHYLPVSEYVVVFNICFNIKN